jgi:hypothetical protein
MAIANNNTTSNDTPAFNPITKELATSQPNNNTTAPNTNSNGTPGTVTRNNDGSSTAVTTETSNGVTNTITTTTPAPGGPSTSNVASVQVNPDVPPPPPNTPEVVITGKKSNSFGDDWRVRLSLAEGANYLYKEEGIDASNLLFPLVDTGGVIFPYLPAINVSYKANYNPVDITHTNYKNYFYQNSSVDEISITADFTAQDNVEAQYMLAVIQFFKSVTKMFYGQDSNPRGGTPPPLCYLSGMGSYQFNNHPLVISSFTYNLPNEVDYIRTETLTAFSGGGVPGALKKGPPKGNILTNFLSSYRLGGSNLNKGATPSKPNFSSITSPESKVTYVPTKIQITLSAFPIVSRKDISENFKLGGKNGYGSGKLIKGGFW